MITYSRTDLIHWNFYISLEKDLENISRYIEFSSANEKTYSIELAKLLMATSSEIDVVLKMLCSLLQSRTRNIDEYRDCIQNKLHELINEEILIERFSMRMKPWLNWDNRSSINPTWWRSYNKVKHERNLNYPAANLKNTINALGALLIVLIHYYKKKENLSYKDTTRLLVPESSLIHLDNNYYNSYMLTE